MGPTSGFAKRLFEALILHSGRQGRMVRHTELGEAIAQAMQREQPLTGAAVGRWFRGVAMPDIPTVRAVAAVLGVDPGWLAFGDDSAAPGPQGPDVAEFIPPSPKAERKRG